MKLPAAHIANIARNAGVPELRVPTFTAVALASSGGLTHYEYCYPMAGVGHQKGLWALDVDTYPEYAATDLFDPHTAAEAAREITERTGGFDWNGAYRSGVWRRFHHHAEVEASRMPAAILGEPPYPVNATMDVYHDAMRQVRNATAQLSQLIGRGR